MATARQTFEAVFAARAPGSARRAERAARGGWPRGRENGWEVASGDAGEATGWAHASVEKAV